MLKALIVGSALIAHSPPVAQQRLSPQEVTRLQGLGAALATCHADIVRRDAPTHFTSAQIVDRALSGCVRHEAPIRVVLYRRMDAERAAQAMQRQRQLWREGIAAMVHQARARRG